MTRPRDQDGGWAWVVLGACSVCLMVTSGLAIVAGMFQTVFLEEWGGGLIMTTWITSLYSSLMQLTGPVSGVVCSVFGCRMSVMTGAVLLTAGLVMSALATDLTTLFFGFGISSGLGLGLIYSAAIVQVNLSFVRYRSLATGSVLAAGGVGVMVMPVVCRYLLSVHSSAHTLLLLAAVSAQLTVAGALLYRDAGDTTRRTTTTRRRWWWWWCPCFGRLSLPCSSEHKKHASAAGKADDNGYEASSLLNSDLGQASTAVGTALAASAARPSGPRCAGEVQTEDDAGSQTDLHPHRAPPAPPPSGGMRGQHEAGTRSLGMLGSERHAQGNAADGPLGSNPRDEHGVRHLEYRSNPHSEESRQDVEVCLDPVSEDNAQDVEVCLDPVSEDNAQDVEVCLDPVSEDNAQDVEVCLDPLGDDNNTRHMGNSLDPQSEDSCSTPELRSDLQSEENPKHTEPRSDDLQTGGGNTAPGPVLPSELCAQSPTPRSAALCSGRRQPEANAPKDAPLPSDHARTEDASPDGEQAVAAVATLLPPSPRSSAGGEVGGGPEAADGPAVLVAPARTLWGSLRLVLTCPSIFLLCLQLFLSSAAVGIVLVHFATFCVQMGSSFEDVAVAFSADGLGMTVSRFMVGALAQDRSLDPLSVYVGLALVSSLIIMLMPVLAVTLPGQIGTMAALGVYCGSSYVLITEITIHCAGVDSLSLAFGLEMVSAGLGYLVAPPLAGWLVVLTNSYRNAIFLSGCLYLVSAFVAMSLSLIRPKWTPGQSSSEKDVTS